MDPKVLLKMTYIMESVMVFIAGTEYCDGILHEPATFGKIQKIVEKRFKDSDEWIKTTEMSNDDFSRFTYVVFYLFCRDCRSRTN